MLAAKFLSTLLAAKIIHCLDAVYCGIMHWCIIGGMVWCLGWRKSRIVVWWIAFVWMMHCVVGMMHCVVEMMHCLVGWCAAIVGWCTALLEWCTVDLNDALFSWMMQCVVGMMHSWCWTITAFLGYALCCWNDALCLLDDAYFFRWCPNFLNDSLHYMPNEISARNCLHRDTVLKILLNSKFSFSNLFHCTFFKNKFWKLVFKKPDEGLID